MMTGNKFDLFDGETLFSNKLNTFQGIPFVKEQLVYNIGTQNTFSHIGKINSDVLANTKKHWYGNICNNSFLHDKHDKKELQLEKGFSLKEDNEKTLLLDDIEIGFFENNLISFIVKKSINERQQQVLFVKNKELLENGYQSSFLFRQKKLDRSAYIHFFEEDFFLNEIQNAYKKKNNIELISKTISFNDNKKTSFVSGFLKILLLNEEIVAGYITVSKNSIQNTLFFKNY